MNPPLLPPAYQELLEALEKFSRCSVTYANDGNVLDVVVGRHTVRAFLWDLCGTLGVMLCL